MHWGVTPDVGARHAVPLRPRPGVRGRVRHITRRGPTSHRTPMRVSFRLGSERTPQSGRHAALPASAQCPGVPSAGGFTQHPSSIDGCLYSPHRSAAFRYMVRTSTCPGRTGHHPGKSACRYTPASWWPLEQTSATWVFANQEPALLSRWTKPRRVTTATPAPFTTSAVVPAGGVSAQSVSRQQWSGSSGSMVKSPCL